MLAVLVPADVQGHFSQIVYAGINAGAKLDFNRVGVDVFPDILSQRISVLTVADGLQMGHGHFLRGSFLRFNDIYPSVFLYESGA